MVVAVAVNDARLHSTVAGSVPIPAPAAPPGPPITSPTIACSEIRLRSRHIGNSPGSFVTLGAGRANVVANPATLPSFGIWTLNPCGVLAAPVEVSTLSRHSQPRTGPVAETGENPPPAGRSISRTLPLNPPAMIVS